ncbi:MAG: large exoprotein involved in heme utilization and adhesion, partial [Halieaceae bacterium]
SLASGGKITAQTTHGSGAGININALDSVVVSGDGAIATDSFGDGRGANISINTVSLVLDSGGQVDSSALNRGAGGNINVNADMISVSGSSDVRLSEISSKSGDIDRQAFVYDSLGYAEGTGGVINLASDTIHIFDGGRVTAEALGAGNAGAVFLGANRLEIEAGAVATSAPQSAGGNIVIQVVDFIGVVDGSITASAGGVTPTDNGGNISIDPELMLLENAQIVATANAGNGGNIDIVAEHIIRDRDTVIDASSKQGIDGDITIDGVVNEVNRIETIEVEYADVTKLLSQRCTLAQLANRSSFVVLGVADTDTPSTGVYQQAPLTEDFVSGSLYDTSDPLLIAELSLLGCPE